MYVLRSERGTTPRQQRTETMEKHMPKGGPDRCNMGKEMADSRNIHWNMNFYTNHDDTTKDKLEVQTFQRSSGHNRRRSAEGWKKKRSNTITFAYKMTL